MVESKKVSIGDEILLHKFTVGAIWVARSASDIQRLHELDASRGRYHDSAGESIVYGPTCGWFETARRSGLGDIQIFHVTVTSKRPKWIGWGRRPKNLRAGWCSELNKEILFQAV